MAGTYPGFVESAPQAGRLLLPHLVRLLAAGFVEGPLALRDLHLDLPFDKGGRHSGNASLRPCSASAPWCGERALELGCQRRKVQMGRAFCGWLDG